MYIQFAGLEKQCKDTLEAARVSEIEGALYAAMTRIGADPEGLASEIELDLASIVEHDIREKSIHAACIAEAYKYSTCS